MHTITNTFLGRPALMQAYVDQILDPIYSGATTGKRKESTATTSSLLQHWEMFGAKKQRYSPGYSLQAIARMKRAPFAFQHNGCVNACQFNAQGTVMLSGSDDLAIKVWRSSTFLDPKEIALASTLHTQHTHNIFHLEFAPNNDHRIFSGAADGELRMYDLNASAGAGVSEVRLQYFAHKMVNHFCFTDPNTVYTAAFGRDGGCVRGVDLRSPGGIQNTIDVLECPSLPVKQVATCPWNLNTLAVGVGSEVRFCDLRNPPRLTTLPPCGLCKASLKPSSACDKR
ncbi:hypothetical protein BASA81_008670 [Batrachochytrium salamandrivorans]|nr:hypothetical protein BASA81_008670 [Batrachochytrium salamandrivorans]